VLTPGTRAHRPARVLAFAEEALFFLVVAVGIAGTIHFLPTGDQVSGALAPLPSLTIWSSSPSPAVPRDTGQVLTFEPPTNEEIDRAGFLAIAGVLGPYYAVVFALFLLRSFGMLPMYRPWGAQDATLHQSCQWVAWPSRSIPGSGSLRPWAAWEAAPLSGLAEYRGHMGGTGRFILALLFALWTNYVALSIAIPIVRDHWGM
jgi:hypothetical protein